MSKRANQLSVPIDSELRQFLERMAAREDRTLAAQVRHLLAEAARQAEQRHAVSA
jgi:hypothetical protein